MIAEDKKKHAIAGVLLGATAIVFGWYSLIPVFVVGIGKEVYDKVSGKGTPEVMDAVATIIPGVLVVAVIYWLSP